MLTELAIPDRMDLKLMVSRNGFIGVLRERGEECLYRRRRPLPSLLLKALMQVTIARVELKGATNLEFIQDQLNEGKRVTIALNHVSDADHPALEHALIADGYPEVANRLLFAAGLKMWDRPQTKWAMWGMNTFPIAAPGYFDRAVEISQLQLSQEERGMVEQYQSNMEWLNKASFNAILPDWRHGKAVVVIYPETTRSRDGLLKRGRGEMGGYFKRGIVVPMMIEGPDEIFPPGQFPCFEAMLRRKFQLTLAVNEPIDTRRLRAPDTKEWLEEKGANLVDFVMSRVAILNPTRVDPQIRPLYEKLLVDIPEGLLLNGSLVSH